MEEISIKIGKDEVQINKNTFLLLLDVSPVKAYEAYKNALLTNEIKFSHLKELAAKADVPYPFFFAPPIQLDKQLKDKEKNLFEKLPSKAEMRLVGRGNFGVEDVALIVRDLGRKQEFLKKRIIVNVEENKFIGYVAKKMKGTHTNRELADNIRVYLGIDLSVLRTKSKAEVVNYIRERAEQNNILVSFSSYNFMPQNLDPMLGMSGLCVKDKKFPIIFVNTRDGDDKPKILESEGRQIFTLTAMLVCIAMNRFIFSTKTSKKKDSLARKVFLIVGEILIPQEDIAELDIKNLEELKRGSTKFKVTPSMLLTRLRECKLIDSQLARRLREKLMDEINSIRPSQKRHPLQTTGYGKYNGVRFSREVLKALKDKKISQDEMKNILFRKGKMNSTLLRDYSDKFK
jgi:Zn-dependent peptidase ImmA (M78 family)